jgi:3-dehydroquinate dehydratase II
VSRSVLVLNGPNLNMLGRRDPAVYGSATLADIEDLCRKTGAELGLDVEVFQSNHEGELVDRINAAAQAGQAVVGNFGAYTHTSIAIMDALGILEAPVVEVHLSNVHARESFRRRSYVSQVADAVIAGAGAHGYALALRHVAQLLEGQA